MKKVFSAVLLVLVLGGLVFITHYTLNNKGIREDVKQKVRLDIEKVNSNETKNNLSQIYNVYFNNEKHKLKLEYQAIEKDENKLSVTIFIYLDGKNVLEREIIKESDSAFADILKNKEITDVILVDEKKIHILKENEIGLLAIQIGFYDKDIKESIYILNGKGDLLNEEGILIVDTSKVYEDNFDKYFDMESKTLAKIDNNLIYSLEEKTVNKKLVLEEYKYFIKDGNLEKELITTYEDIALKVKTKENK